jgi:hypothetical protein
MARSRASLCRARMLLPPRAASCVSESPQMHLTASRSHVAMLHRRQWDRFPMSRLRPDSLPPSPRFFPLSSRPTLHLVPHFRSATLPLCFSHVLDVSIRIIWHFPSITSLCPSNIRLSSVSHGRVFSIATPRSLQLVPVCRLYVPIRIASRTVCAIAAPFLAL